MSLKHAFYTFEKTLRFEGKVIHLGGFTLKGWWFRTDMCGGFTRSWWWMKSCCDQIERAQEHLPPLWMEHYLRPGGNFRAWKVILITSRIWAGPPGNRDIYTSDSFCETKRSKPLALLVWQPTLRMVILSSLTDPPSVSVPGLHTLSAMPWLN